MNHKTKVKALSLLSLTRSRRKGDIPVISFEDLRVPFQDPSIMDLRNIGICSLGMDKDGRCGVSMRAEYAEMNMKEFTELINKF